MAARMKSLTLQNFLSFSETPTALDLRNLNVLIGPNGSGKTNLIEAIHLLHNTPSDLAAFLRQGGGIQEWIWKGDNQAVKERRASIEADIGLEPPLIGQTLHHRMEFAPVGLSFEITDERIEIIAPKSGQQPDILFGWEDDRWGIKTQVQPFERVQFPLLTPVLDRDAKQSILSQRKSPDAYPELTALGKYYETFGLYREWNIGRLTASRQAQPTDQPNDFILTDFSNLGLIRNAIHGTDGWDRLIGYLQRFYEPVKDIVIRVEAGRIQVFLKEKGLANLTPATRLSDGTIHFLCLLAILLHSSPPPLVVLEEPELGLHPDAIALVAELLHVAAERTQLIVTTHSDLLVGAIQNPEDVIVCNKLEGVTSFMRLNGTELETWLESYSLGELWLRGQFGGVRW